MLRAIGYVLNVQDVLKDAHNTFIKENKQETDDETQLQDILKEKPFNWSDEDISFNDD